LIQVVTDEEQGVTYARCYPPTGGMIELVSPQDASKASAGSIKEHLDSRGEGMYAIVLQAPDVGFVSDNLSSRGIDVRTVDEGSSKSMCSVLVFVSSRFARRELY
jgi:hypothetical protein